MHKERNIGIAIEILGNGAGVGLQMIVPASPTLGWIIIVVSNAIGFGLIGYSMGKPDTVVGQSTTDKIVLGHPKKRLDFRDRMALDEIIETMERIHGHADEASLEVDMLKGVLPSDLLNKTCGKCGKPRNQEGDFVL